MSNNPKANPDKIFNVKFNLKSLEQFTNNRGVLVEHWSAIPSPIGLKDRGEYRRSDALDTVSENGFIYTKVGDFVGTIMGNSHQNGKTAGQNIYDASNARLVLPKFYKDSDTEISLLPGDRIYAKNIELKVDNYQRAEYIPSGSDYLQFPAKEVSILIDSQGKKYTYKRDFKINKDGNIQWYVGKKNPGIDVDTGKGRVYSIRYKYVAFWYISSLINEIRITNTDGADTPERMPYQANIQREYVYHNRTRGDVKENPTTVVSDRTVEKPVEKLNPNEYEIKVDVSNFE